MALSVTMSAAGITCRIPFGFSVNGKTLPAGWYSLSTSDLILTVKGPHASAVAMTKQTPSSGNETGMRLVFLKTGDRYELIEAWTGGSAGFEVQRSGKRPATTPGERVVIPVK
jgi:hypothetical protein